MEMPGTASIWPSITAALIFFNPFSALDLQLCYVLKGAVFCQKQHLFAVWKKPFGFLLKETDNRFQALWRLIPNFL